MADFLFLVSRAPRPGFAPRFLKQPDRLDDHPAVHRLEHVVDREQCDAGGCHGLHLDAGTPYGLRGGDTFDDAVLVVEFEIDADVGQRNRVTKRNQGSRLFGRHDACQSCDAKYIPFFGVPLRDLFEGGGHHADLSRCHRSAMRFRLDGNIHHVRLSSLVEVGEGVAHGALRVAANVCRSFMLAKA